MHHFIIIRGPSGSGKSTLAREIQSRLEGKAAMQEKLLSLNKYKILHPHKIYKHAVKSIPEVIS